MLRRFLLTAVAFIVFAGIGLFLIDQLAGGFADRLTS